MTEIGVFKYIGRSMERTGFLKRLIKRVSVTSTSSFDNLGHDIIEVVTRKFRVPITTDRYDYLKARLRISFQKPDKEKIDEWLKNPTNVPEILMELQDIYLSDPAIPSKVGRLVDDNWRRYPALGTNLGLIRKGTYSMNTRGLSLLYLTDVNELQAFHEVKPEYNPLIINDKQALLLLYSFFENDGEIICILWRLIRDQLPKDFSDKDAGNFIPQVYKTIIRRYRSRSISVEIKERLEVLEKTANNIEKYLGTDYGGTSPRDVAIRPRIEPYVDFRIFGKNDPTKYEYYITDEGLVWLKSICQCNDNLEISKFLATRFFTTAAEAKNIQSGKILSPNQIVSYLYKASKNIGSPSGYVPIEELAILAGIEALIENKVIIEPAIARQALIEYQKANPYRVRFTVNRMGVLAHARFLEAPASTE